MDNKRSLRSLAREMRGDLFTDEPYRLLYATDASAYREIPIAVARPMDENDIFKLIGYAFQNGITLIPRAAGTSLAGQVVGGGIVVDLSKYFTRIIEINKDDSFVTLQPGVVLDELNLQVAHQGLFFGPETSTSNRCMIGGMVGNNACGAHSLIYGSTRDHLLEVKGFLSNGDQVTFSAIDDKTFAGKLEGSNLESRIYRDIHSMLINEKNRTEINNGFPDPLVKRRNTGYALDALLGMSPFTPAGDKFNFSKLVAGSEGTLLFATEIKLNLVPLPPKVKGLLCVHFNTLEESLQANLICLKHNPGAIELMDDTILECTKANITQRKNRFFIQGDPGAILIVEFARTTFDEIKQVTDDLINDLKQSGFGYHFPLVTGDDINKVWALRKSGLGVLSNIPGDAKPVSLIEDTAVRPDLLPNYIRDIRELLTLHGLSCVFHAHIATGELHMRPVIDLKDPQGVKLFRTIATEVAHLVKKYKGSLSGEHGDGRLRGEFIPVIVGDHNYQLMRQVKQTWDPQGVFNKGKITDTPKMDTFLRTREIKGNTVNFKPVFDHSATLGFVRHIEQCNGSGDCRKSALMGGTMCPSYMATKDEDTTTRARANALREYLVNPLSENRMSMEAVYDVLDLCLSCKGCKSECPSNVDMAKLKAEFMQHYHDKKGVSLNAWLVANIARIHRINSHFPWFYNTAMKSRLIQRMVKSMLGFANQRTLPLLSGQSFEKWLKQNSYLKNGTSDSTAKREVYLFVDEFTNFLEAQIGIAAIKVLRALNYNIHVASSRESGRTFLSKGLLRKAKKIAVQNVRIYSKIINDSRVLVGIEPSAILAFRDEYPELVGKPMQEDARKLALNSFTFDEFIAAEFQAGNIDRRAFTSEKQMIKFHGHCQQKAISTTAVSKIALTIPENYTVEEIRSGCCGMAGAFGFEKSHYDISMKIGELVLFPAVRNSEPGTIICATGTSCRQQILDGTGVEAFHPAEVLYKALKK